MGRVFFHCANPPYLRTQVSGEGSFGCGVAQGGEEERLQRGYAHERELRCFAWGRARSHEEALLARTHAPLLAFSPSLLCPTFSALFPLEPGHEGIDE